MRLKNPTIILVKPQLPENIGLAARAMHNCGLDNLIIVAPKEKWPSKKTIDASANAKIIIEKAKVFETINEAVSNYNYVIATSARRRYLQKPHKKNFSSLFYEIEKFKKIAIIFGPERAGLSNNDLMLCDCIFTIPCSENNPSFNLAHSVLLMAYKLKEHFQSFDLKPIKIDKLSDKKTFDMFMTFLKKELHDSGFLHPKEKSHSMVKNVQAMFLRANLSKKEIQTLWGMIKLFRNPKKR